MPCRICLVCSGNVRRSAMATAVLREKPREAGHGATVDIGRGVDRWARAALKSPPQEHVLGLLERACAAGGGPR